MENQKITAKEIVEHQIKVLNMWLNDTTRKSDWAEYRRDLAQAKRRLKAVK